MKMFFVANTYRKQVVAQYPCAAKIVKTEGGYAVFMTIDEYNTWKNQK